MTRNLPVRVRPAAALTLTTAVPTGSGPAQAQEVTLPGTIPSIDQRWQPTHDGVYTRTQGTAVVGAENVAQTRDLLAQELGLTAALDGHVPDAADISLVIDASRDDLGSEGYELRVSASQGVTITAGSGRGVFYGTRTLGQMLRQQSSLPAGSVIDIPRYKERGITVCACQINIQTDWIDRLLTDMADLKLNYLLLEMKLKSDRYPETSSWSYYRREDVKALVDKAERLGIEVIPEINSPGHMGIWLERCPQLQLVDRHGVRHPEMLDISNPQAVGLYLGLVDEYRGVFKTPYWHVGGDEYMIGTSPSEFPELSAWAERTYGPGATIDDAFIAFINQVNRHVKAAGGRLRMWNDGVMDTQVVKLDQDVIVELWYVNGKTAQQLVAAGAQVMNAHDSLYWSRSAAVYKVDARRLWDRGWTVAEFPGKGGQLDPDSPQILGAKASIWPDDSVYQTENEVEEEVVDGTRFLAQMTWTASQDGMTWTDFKSRIDTLGRNPLWNTLGDRTPLDDGAYTITLDGKELAGTGQGVVADGVATDTWALEATPDHYYQLRSESTGLCLAVTEGTKHLSVVTEVGARPGLVACADPQVRWDQPGACSAAQARNTQKWQVIARGAGYTLRNALSNQDLTVATGQEQHVDLTEAGGGAPLTAGTVVQLPADLTRTLASLVPAGARPRVRVSAPVEPARPGAPATATVTVSNSSGTALEGISLRLGPLPGWKTTVGQAPAARLEAGVSSQATVLLEPTTAVGPASLLVEITWEGGSLSAQTQVAATCGALVTPEPVGADSQDT